MYNIRFRKWVFYIPAILLFSLAVVLGGKWKLAFLIFSVPTLLAPYLFITEAKCKIQFK